MATAIRTIGHEDRLSLVDHLEELRTRLIVSALVLAVAFGVCLWQNHALLHIINRPLHKQTQKQVAKGEGHGRADGARPAGRARRSPRDTQAALGVLGAPAQRPAGRDARRSSLPLIPALQADVAKIPRIPQRRQPGDARRGRAVHDDDHGHALLRAGDLAAGDPVRALRLHPARVQPERATRRGAAADRAIPFLFAAGVLFGYFVVLPAAVRFFVNFNASEFNVLVQASQYYKFAATVLLAMGLVFQVPVVILAATRAGHRDPAAAAQEPPLRDRRVRGDRRVPARRRDHAGARDRAAVCALRGEYPAGVAC